jgi:hypothetical protein
MERIFKQAQYEFKNDEPILRESVKDAFPGEWKVGDLVQTPWGKIKKISEVTQKPNSNGYSGYYRLEGDVFCHLGLHLRKI